MSSAVTHSYNYAFPSLVDASRDKQSLTLATSGGVERNPYFFDGLLTSPKQTADLLLALSAISRTRFYSPGLLRERILASADPVVTCDGTQLRFEVFSVCAGVYARFDLTGNAIDGSWLSKGTTNVDFNPPMRAALATLTNQSNAGLKIGTESVELHSEENSVVERKVKLPIRWLRSFVEVQSYQTELKPVMEMAPAELNKLLVPLPQQSLTHPGEISYISPVARGYRLSQRAASGNLPVGAINRLKAIEPILRNASTVKTYSGNSGVSAFQITFDQGNFLIVLSPNAARGFSGEGQALSELVSRVADSTIAKVRARLAWQSNLAPDILADQLGLETDDVKNALQVLGTRGLVGYDAIQKCYYHREMPFDLALVEDLHPRISKARKLLYEGAVKITSNEKGRDTLTANVSGESGDYLVQIKGDTFRCTCSWHLKHQGDRGPCSHVLAVELKGQDE